MRLLLISRGHSALLAQFVLGLFWMLGMRLMASTTEQLEADLRDAVMKAMFAADLVPKQLADNAGISLSHLHHCLNPERPEKLAIAHVVRFGFRFWCFFGPTLMRIVAQRRWQELADEFNARRPA